MNNQRTCGLSPENNTYIFDAKCAQEIARLVNQDWFVTRAMGGPLAGLPELPEKAQILDLGCGPGGWVLDAAFERADCVVVGVDISQVMIGYGRARAHLRHLTNASFGIMDITRPQDFADASFDLVQVRFLLAALKREAWQPFLAECMRLVRPGGTLRFTEAEDLGRSNSPALTQLNELAIKVLWQAGYGFSPDGHSFGMISGLQRLLKQAGYHDVHVASYTVDYSANADSWSDCYHNIDLIFQQMRPLFLYSGLIETEKLDRLYQQAICDMYSDHFTAIGKFFSIYLCRNCL